jgi:hypothetical protein
MLLLMVRQAIWKIKEMLLGMTGNGLLDGKQATVDDRI